METYATWARMFERQKCYWWIVDPSTSPHRRIRNKHYANDYDFHWLEQRLLPLNFRIVFYVRSPESFEAARAQRLKVSGNPSQYHDLALFIHEQELMREPVARAILPSLTLDISDNNIC